MNKNQVTDKRYPEVFRFQFEDIVNDPMFGSASNLLGEIPFIQPTKRLTAYRDFVERNPEMVENICRGIVSKYRNFWIDETDDDVFEIVRKQVPVALTILGEFPTDELRDGMTQFLVLAFAADNATDKHGLELLDEIGGDCDYAGLTCSWRSSPVPPLDSIPSGVAELDQLLKLGKVGIAEAEQLIPDFMDFYSTIRDDVIAMCTAHFHTFEMERHKDEPRLSEESMADLRVHLSGMKLHLDFIPLFKGIRISPEIRRDDMFQMTLNRASDIFVVVNAVLGLPRDVRLRQVDSPITCSVVHDKVPLQDAFNTAVKQLHRLYNDFVFANKKLAQLYKNEPHVQAHAECLDWLVDGFLYAYKMRNARYGVDHQIEIVKKQHSV